MVLVPAKEFASSHAAPTRSVFQQPALFSKGETAHGCGAGVPVDGCNKLRREAVFAVPVLARAICKGEGIELFLVHFGEFFLIDPQGPFFQSEGNTGHPGLSQSIRVPEAFGKTITFYVELPPAVEPGKGLGIVLMGFYPARRERQWQQLNPTSYVNEQVEIGVARVEGPITRGLLPRLIPI